MKFRDDGLIKLGFYISYVAIGLGALFGLLQVLERIPGVTLVSAGTYYLSLTAHGVLMALVFTTFFIMSLATYVVTRELGMNTFSYALNRVSYALVALGTVMAAVPILLGKASVLYTFYPPMKASPLFYIGATVLVIGTWIFGANLLLTVKKWRSAGNARRKLPLGVFGVVATLIIWYIATTGIAIEMLFQLIPWSLGLVERIDPLLARNFFWYFGHPLVYFWLLPAYIVWYTILPRLLNTPIFSDFLARVVFVLFILFSTPVGYHHQFMDPGIEAGWKFLHTTTTFFVFVPSLITAFTVTATMELAARRRGGRGLLGWIGALPWRDPVFASIAFAMILFGFGGATGAVNAGNNLNYVVHNTAWVPGHLHLTVGTAVALTFMGLTYLLLPSLTGKQLHSRKLALAQVYLWFFGMVLFSSAMHYLGILGSPRRTYDVTYGGAQIAQEWGPFLIIAAVGGILLFLSVALFLYNVFRTLTSGVRIESPRPEGTPPLPQGEPGLVDNFKIFAAIALVLVLIAYLIPTANIIALGTPGAPPVEIR